jgi:23S rRNA (guanine745-N1)-methyltransferase
MRLARADALALASMGPSARHVRPAELAQRVGALEEPVTVSAAVRVESWRPRGPASELPA